MIYDITNTNSDDMLVDCMGREIKGVISFDSDTCEAELYLLASNTDSLGCGIMIIDDDGNPMPVKTKISLYGAKMIKRESPYISEQFVRVDPATQEQFLGESYDH